MKLFYVNIILRNNKKHLLIMSVCTYIDELELFVFDYYCYWCVFIILFSKNINILDWLFLMKPTFESKQVISISFEMVLTLRIYPDKLREIHNISS